MTKVGMCQHVLPMICIQRFQGWGHGALGGDGVAGLDPAEMISQLRAAHAQDETKMGVDVVTGQAGNMQKLGIFESFKVGHHSESHSELCVFWVHWGLLGGLLQAKLTAVVQMLACDSSAKLQPAQSPPRSWHQPNHKHHTAWHDVKSGHHISDIRSAPQLASSDPAEVVRTRQGTPQMVLKHF